MDLVKKTGCARGNGMEMTTHLLIHAFIYSSCVYWMPSLSQSTICLAYTVNKKDMVHLLVEIIVYREKQITNEKTNVAGSHQEDKMEGWLTSCAQVIGGSPLLPLSLECTFCPQWELFLMAQCWESNVLLNFLYGISDWNQSLYVSF